MYYSTSNVQLRVAMVANTLCALVYVVYVSVLLCVSVRGRGPNPERHIHTSPERHRAVTDNLWSPGPGRRPEAAGLWHAGPVPGYKSSG